MVDDRQIISEEVLLTHLRIHTDRQVPGSGLAQRIGRILPQELRSWVRVLITRLILPQQRLLAAYYRSQLPLKLNIGCGTLPLQGWINIDLIGLPVDLIWDIRYPLPFGTNTVDAIFHEHVIEHLNPLHGYSLLKDCYRMLKPGGIMRIVAPDASKYLHSYIDREHQFLKAWRPGRLRPLMALQEEFYGFGHRAIYDSDTMALFCNVAGFSIIESRQFGDTRLTPCPDSEWRITDSFYTEVVK